MMKDHGFPKANDHSGARRLGLIDDRSASDGRLLRELLIYIVLPSSLILFAIFASSHAHAFGHTIGHEIATLVVLIGIYLVALVVPFLRETQMDYFSPITFYMVYKTQLIGRPIIQLATGDYSNHRLPFLGTIEVCNLLCKTLVIWDLGLLAFLIGYYGGFHRFVPSPRLGLRKGLDMARVRIAGVVLLAWAVFCCIMVIRHGGGWQAMLDHSGDGADHIALSVVERLYRTSLDLFPPLCLMIIALPAVLKRQFPWGTIVLTAAFVVAMAATGDRATSLLPLFTMAVFLNYLYRRLRFWKCAVILFSLASIALSMQDVRRATATGQSYDVRIVQRRFLSSGSLVYEFFSRRITCDGMGVMLYLMPEELPFQYGRTYLNVLAFPIPRALWPDKPLIDESGLVGRALLGSEYFGIPVDTEGVLFMNFHMVGVVVGCLVFGAIHKRIYLAIVRHRQNPSAMILYAMVLLRIMSFTGASLCYLALTVVPVWLVLQFVGSDVTHRFRSG